MKNKIFSKNILAAIILLSITINGVFANTASDINMAQTNSKDNRQNVKSNVFSQLVKLNKQEFILRCKFDIPDNEVLQKTLAGRMFGNNTLLLNPALQDFLAKADMTSDKLPKKLYGNNFISMGCQCLSSYNGPDYQFDTYLYYVTLTINNLLKNGGAGLPKETRGHITYDTRLSKVLTIADILTEETIKSMELDATSTNMHITPMGKLICYTSADTGKEIDINSENKSMFSEYFKKIIKEPMKTEAEDMLTAKEIVAEEGPQYEEKPLDIAEVMPSFPGGDAAMMQWLSVNITYPPIAEENGVQGRIIVRFYVGKDGAIYNPKVLRSVDPSLDKEALRVVKSMPRWIPGKQKGEPVAVYFTLPVTFQLQ